MICCILWPWMVYLLIIAFLGIWNLIAAVVSQNVTYLWFLKQIENAKWNKNNNVKWTKSKLCVCRRNQPIMSSAYQSMKKSSIASNRIAGKHQKWLITRVSLSLRGLQGNIQINIRSTYPIKTFKLHVRTKEIGTRKQANFFCESIVWTSRWSILTEFACVVWKATDFCITFHENVFSMPSI